MQEVVKMGIGIRIDNELAKIGEVRKDKSKRMKDSGIEWIGEIPEEWELKPLRAIFQERKEKNNPIKTKNILSLTAEQGVIPYNKKSRVGGNKPKEDLTKYHLTYKNDIVMNSMNILSGAVGLSKYFGAISPVYYSFYTRNNAYNPDYYYRLFQTEAFQKNLFGLGNGIVIRKSKSSGKLNTIRMRIPMFKLNSLILPVPSIEEQKRISLFLNKKVDKIDNIIKKVKNSIDDFSKYKEALIIEVTTKGLNQNVRMKDSRIAWIGEAPEHWKLVKAKYVIYKLSRERIMNGNTIICSNSGKTILRGERNTGLVSETQHDYQGVEVGDLLIHGMDTWHGAIAISKYRGDCTSVVHVCDSNQNKEYLAYFLRMLAIKQVYKAISNGVRENTSDFRSWEKVGDIVIALPSIYEQEQIVDYLNNKCLEIDKIIEAKEQLIEELESYKKSLIYEYVTGKKQVN